MIVSEACQFQKYQARMSAGVGGAKKVLAHSVSFSVPIPGSQPDEYPTSRLSLREPRKDLGEPRPEIPLANASQNDPQNC